MPELPRRQHVPVDEDGRPGPGAGVFATPLIGGFEVRCSCGYASWSELRVDARRALSLHVARRSSAGGRRERVGAYRA
jgi:hypothetical protein